MQRSFLLAILQVLASSGDASAPMLLLACEEPELYQHPPQIRHLASVLRKLSKGNAHVVLSTHSPLFVTGREFESVRLVRRESIGGPTKVRHATLQAVSDAIKAARGGKTFDDPARLAKLHESLHPGLSEMFFAERLVLVEGHSDQAYLASCLELQGRWEEFRRLGIHVVPAGNKSHLIQPRAVASLLGIPTFTIFDADSNSKVENGHRAQHDLDNCTLLRLCGETEMPLHPWPTRQTANLVMWTTNIEDAVKSSTDGTAYSNAVQAAHKHFGYVEGSLVKDAVFIAKVIETLFESGHKPGALADLADRVIAFFKV